MQIRLWEGDLQGLNVPTTQSHCKFHTILKCRRANDVISFLSAFILIDLLKGTSSFS